MSQETTIYLVNLIIGAMLALLMTQHWRRDRQAHGLRYWTLAAWTLAVADLLFALRPTLPFWAGRFFPTLMVTVGHGVLLLAADRTAGREMRWRIVLAVAVAHAIALGAFLALAPESQWRTVVNGVTWGGLSLAAAVALRFAPETIRTAFLIPAIVFLWQAVFHTWRSLTAARGAVRPDAGSEPLLQLLGDLEVSLFMVALFVSVLAAHLRAALSDVRQLSSLLRICAWCNKIRTDDGQWERIERYLMQRRIDVTHAICESCAAQATAVAAPTGPASGPDPAKRIAP
jgi:hypothetical protein